MEKFIRSLTTTTTTLPPSTNPNVYRFGGLRCTLRAPDKRGPDDIIPQEPGLYAFPKGDENKG